MVHLVVKRKARLFKEEAYILNVLNNRRNEQDGRDNIGEGDSQLAHHFIKVRRFWVSYRQDMFNRKK